MRNAEYTGKSEIFRALLKIANFSWAYDFLSQEKELVLT